MLEGPIFRRRPPWRSTGANPRIADRVKPGGTPVPEGLICATVVHRKPASRHTLRWRGPLSRIASLRSTVHRKGPFRCTTSTPRVPRRDPNLALRPMICARTQRGSGRPRLELCYLHYY
jgi:hypothetical protein